MVTYVFPYQFTELSRAQSPLIYKFTEYGGGDGDGDDDADADADGDQ